MLLQYLKILPTEHEALYGLFGKAPLPSGGDDLHFTGFPRSGNTFGKNLIASVFPELKMTTHIHRIASIKCALNRKVPVVVTYRNPVDCISSYLVKAGGTECDASLIRYVLLYYQRYHAYLLDNANHMTLVRFEELVGDSYHFIETISRITSRRLGSSGKQVEQKKQALIDHMLTRYEGGRSPHERNMYNESKETAKIRIREILDGAAYKRHMDAAAAIYESILRLHDRFTAGNWR